MRKISVPAVAAVGLTILPWILVVLLVTQHCGPEPTPPNVVQQAAERAAGAIVTVERADSALARNERVIESTAPKRVKVVALQERRDTATVPEAVIATQDTIIAVQDSIIVAVDSSNRSLATALEVTRDTLATYRTPIIPAVPQRSSLLDKISSVAKHIGPSIGYGAVLANGEVQTGPTALVGVHVTHGVIGVTAGFGVTQAGGELHTGAGVNVGVRLVL